VCGSVVVMMSRRRWQNRSRSKLRLAAALAIIALASTGCTSQLADLAEPAETPARPTVAPAYPAVHSTPVARDTTPLTAEERQRIADELSALRERQEVETTGSIPARKPSGR
jgi:hypothetical protein